MKQALIAVSFGTSHHDTLEKTIVLFEQTLATAFPERTVVRAFTSSMIMKRLRERDGLDIPNVAQALEQLLAQGYDDVLIQPSHVINGDEYDKLCAQAAPFVSKFARLSIGRALLTSVEDYFAVAEALCEQLPLKTEDTAIVYMGHGTTHHANSVYPMLEYVLRDMGREDVVIGTVEGYPAFEQVAGILSKRTGVKKIIAYPLMIVAGDHAKNDLAGEEEDSWRAQLEAMGYAVDCVLQGMGELTAICDILCAHAKAAEQEAV
ncbi:sirohydrochlorin cobaltochelatase [Bengtsoniella intestinalis]|uniref:sirohydrochlorin cobaltochelatase n=1 Tax=Bengtsoniella intestinalis TaxID=3073143 RepID=UPI00391FC13D